MAVLQLSNGHDVTVKASVAETVSRLDGGLDEFVEFEAEGGNIHARRSGVIAVLEEADKRGRAGFHPGESGGH